MSSLDTLFPLIDYLKIISSLNSPPLPSNSRAVTSAFCVIMSGPLSGARKKGVKKELEQAPLRRFFTHLDLLLCQLVSFLQKKPMVTVTSAGLAQTMKLGMYVRACLSAMTLNPRPVFCFIWGCDLPRVSNSCLPQCPSIQPRFAPGVCNFRTPAIPDRLSCRDLCVNCLI